MTPPASRSIALAAGFLFPLEAAVAIYVWRFGPTGPLPVHFGLNGEVDRYGDRSEIALVMGGMALIGSMCWVVLEVMRRRSQNPSGLAWAQVVLLSTFALIGLVEATLASGGHGSGAGSMGMAALAILFIAIGAVLGKVSPNPFVGVRTYWSLNSRLAWDKSNRLGGRLMFWIGLAGLAAAPFAPQPLGFQVLIGAIILGAGLSVAESWRVWRIDPDRARS